MEQLAADQSLYNVTLALHLDGALSVEALGRSLDEIVRRHESLRTVFRVVDGDVMQLVLPPLHLEAPVSDLSELSAEARDAAALIVTDEATRTRFDLTRWPLMRPRVLRLTSSAHLLIITLHHIICDDWSLGIFRAELSTLYGAFSSALPSPLPALPLQYPDFSEWERQWLAGPEATEQLEYWKRQLDGAARLRLPTDRQPPERPTFDGAELWFEVPTATFAALRSLGGREDVTLFMTLLAGFQTLLHRYSGQEDIVVGTTVAHRDRQELEPLIGFMANSLPLRSDFAGDPTFREVLRRVRTVVLDAFLHQQMPFQQLVSESRPERSALLNPFFGVHFQLLRTAPQVSGAEEATGAGGLESEVISAAATTAKFDLSIDLWDSEQGLWGHIEYSTELWDFVTMRELADSYVALLGAVAADPDQAVGAVPLVTADERARLLQAARGPRDNRPGACLHELVASQARRTPDAPAVTWRTGALTYRELDRRAESLAAHLRRAGAGPNRVVALYLHRSPDLIVALLATLKSGSAFLALNPSDPPSRTRHILSDASPHVALATHGTADGLSMLAVPCLFVDTPLVDPLPSGERVPAVAPGDPAYLVYTSGSTGGPKGVAIEHRSICNHLRWMQAVLPVHPGDRALVKYPVNFDAAVYEIFGPLTAGARLHLLPRSEPFDATEFVHTVRDESITLLDVVPSMLDALLDDPSFALCASVRRVVVGGEELTRALADRFAASLPAELHNIYGPTEATIGVTWHRVGDERGRARVPIGRPGLNTQAYVLDDRLEPVPVGMPGELYLAGDCVARGYVGQAAATAERFLPDPFGDTPGGRMYRTGDIVRIRSDGALEYLRRADDQVKVRGHRVEPLEIEMALQAHDDVRASAVVPVSQGETVRLLAYVVPAAGVDPSGLASALRRYLEMRLPPYLVPATVSLCTELPRGPTGKLDRRVLRDMVPADPAADHVPPRPTSATERRCIEIWREVLGREEISAEGNFFDLGGDSLLLTRARSRLAAAFGREIAIVDLFRYPTVRSLARHLELGGDTAGLDATAVAPAVERREDRYGSPALTGAPMEDVAS